MAKAERFERTGAGDLVGIVMTIEEARTLRDILSQIGGSPYLSRRIHADSIADALDEVGFKHNRRSCAEDMMSGAIYFKEIKSG